MRLRKVGDKWFLTTSAYIQSAISERPVGGVQHQVFDSFELARKQIAWTLREYRRS